MNGKCQHENCGLHNQLDVSQDGDKCTVCGITSTPDPNAAYNSKVRQIAEMISRDTLQDDQWERMSAESNEYRIERKTPIARAMVAEMADIFIQGMAYASPCAVPINTDYELKRRGLIPNTKTENDAR